MSELQFLGSLAELLGQHAGAPVTVNINFYGRNPYGGKRKKRKKKVQTVINNNFNAPATYIEQQMGRSK